MNIMLIALFVKCGMKEEIQEEDFLNAKPLNRPIKYQFMITLILALKCIQCNNIKKRETTNTLKVGLIFF